MAIVTIKSNTELNGIVKNSKKAYLLLYKAGSEQSMCAYKNLEAASQISDDILLMAADVSEVRDIHTVYNITSAPSLLEFDEGNFKKDIKGCHEPAFFKAMFDNAVYAVKAAKEGKRVKSVIVYSTPTCSWCTRLKDYLKMHKIPFRDIDVSKDMRAAEELVKRSGQQGVPQTEIDGQIIVGFDKTKINSLLEIQE